MSILRAGDGRPMRPGTTLRTISTMLKILHSHPFMAIEISSINDLLPRIPPELYRPIVECIHDISTLYALALSSQILRYEAERRLYFRMSKSTLDSNSAQISFLTTVIHNPRLAALVHEYTSYEITKYRRNPLWSLTQTALRSMVNLKVLNFRTFGGHPAAVDLLVGCPFRLEKLHWGNHSDEEAMARVLVEQQELKELYLIGSEQRTALPRTACPDLRVLCGNRAVIEALVPGRRITNLSWVPELGDPNTTPILGMEAELAKLKTLSFGGYFSRPSFTHLAHQLLSLEVLELIGLNSMTELQLLKHLPSLREVVISLRWGSAHVPIPAADRFPVVQALFKDSPNLVLVDIVHDWPKLGLIRYQRWVRFALESVLVPLSDIRVGRFIQ